MNCSECGAPTFTDPARGEVACTGCGLVVEHTLLDARPAPVYEDSGTLNAETVSFTNTGVPNTRFTNEARDGRGGSIDQETRDRMKRLSWLNAHTLRRKDRSVKRLYGMLTAACNKLEFGARLRDRAFYLTKKAYEKGALRNQEFALLVGSTIMLAAQEAGRHTTAEEVLGVLPVTRKNPERQLFRAYRTVKRSLGMFDVRATPETIVAKLSLRPDVRREANVILRGMTSRQKPEVDASLAVFVAAQRVGRPIPQTHVAKMCGTTDVSLRGRLRKDYSQYVQAPKPELSKPCDCGMQRGRVHTKAFHRTLGGRMRKGFKYPGRRRKAA